MRRLILLIMVLGLGVGGAISFAPGSIPLFMQMNAALYSLWLPKADPAALDPRITVVDIDDRSLLSYGRWPWPRHQLAELVEKISSSDAAVIGLDILLPEPAPGDEKLGQALQDPRIVTASAWSINAGNSEGWSSAKFGLPPSFSLGSPDQGHITPIYDPDGQIRRLAPIICHLDRCYPTLAARMLEKLIQQPLELVTYPSEQLCIGPYCQPLSSTRLLRIPYRRQLAFNRISAMELLSGQARIATGSLVLVGTSATGLGDLVSTPLSIQTPGVNVHAQLLSGWLDGVQLETLPRAGAINLTCITILLLAAAGYGIAAPTQRRWLLTASAAAALPPLALWFSIYWVSPLPILWSLAFAIALLLLGRLAIQQQEKERITTAFSHYIPDSVMTQLLESGESLDRLDACDAKVSVMFVDIRDFTQLTDDLGANAVVQLTRYVFTELTTIIHESEGTLDKFIGDAAMAFWGAPTAQPDHAKRALHCAMQIMEAMPAINAGLNQLGLPPVALSIGLDSGPVIAGNLGAQQRRAYTVIGTPVNRAARIQALACELEHPVLVGKTLREKLNDRSSLSLAGKFTLKGFSHPEPIYTISD